MNVSYDNPCVGVLGIIVDASGSRNCNCSANALCNNLNGWSAGASLRVRSPHLCLNARRKGAPGGQGQQVADKEIVVGLRHSVGVYVIVRDVGFLNRAATASA